jgi:hypothetical protein
LTKVGATGTSDESLATVYDIEIALPNGAGLHRCRIGTRVRFGLHETEVLFAFNNWI